MDMTRMLELAGVPLNESKKPVEQLDESAKAKAIAKKVCDKLAKTRDAIADMDLTGLKDKAEAAKIDGLTGMVTKALDELCKKVDAFSAKKLTEEEELAEKMAMALAGTGKTPKTPTDDPKAKDADAKRLPKGDGKDPKLDDDPESPEGVAAKSKEWQAFLKKSDDKNGGKQPKAPGTK